MEKAHYLSRQGNASQNHDKILTKYHRIARIKRVSTAVVRTAEKLQSSHTAGENMECCSHLGKSLAVY